jgi:hypothetical protein
MIKPPSARSLLRKIALPLACLLPASLPASAEMLYAKYSVSLLGLHVGDASATGLLNGAAYKIDLNAKLTGLAAVLATLRVALASYGAIHKGVVAPAAYATTAASSHETRTVRIALNAGTVKAVDISPPFEDMEGRIPVTEANKRNVVDPSSALIMTVPAGQPLVGPAACNRTIPIYDGVLRFDVTLSYVGTKQVSTKGYSGPVSVCAARYTPVAGHKVDSKSAKFMAENRHIEAWLAPVEPAHVVVPFHVSLLTQAGVADIDAVEFKIEPGDVTAATQR